jgi:hypothetical protein
MVEASATSARGSRGCALLLQVDSGSHFVEDDAEAGGDVRQRLALHAHALPHDCGDLLVVQAREEPTSTS